MDSLASSVEKEIVKDKTNLLMEIGLVLAVGEVCSRAIPFFEWAILLALCSPNIWNLLRQRTCAPTFVGNDFANYKIFQPPANIAEAAQSLGLRQPVSFYRIQDMGEPFKFHATDNPNRHVAISEDLHRKLKPHEFYVLCLHELTHLRFRHSVRRGAVSAINSLLLFASSATSLIINDYKQLELTALTGVAAFFISKFLFRENERRADAMAALLSKQPHTFARALLRIKTLILHQKPGSTEGYNIAENIVHYLSPRDTKGRLRKDIFAAKLRLRASCFLLEHPPTCKRLRKMRRMAFDLA